MLILYILSKNYAQFMLIVIHSNPFLLTKIMNLKDSVRSECFSG